MIGISYEQSGVSLARGDAASADAFARMQTTFNPEILMDSGLPVVHILKVIRGMKEPRFHSTMDGVGTKLIYAAVCGIYNTVGFDLVAMCVDDHSRYNIKPINFTLYRGTNKIDEQVFAKVAEGVVEACIRAGVSYTGGETAEMPDFYANTNFELVGTSNGVYDTGTLRRGQGTRPGDLLVALPSYGGGSNGFSLTRRIFPPKEVASGKAAVSPEVVLKPTPIYTQEVLVANKRFKSIRGWAHITGGGLGERGKLSSLLPNGLVAVLDRSSWEVPPIFRQIQTVGQVDDERMFETYNMGLMMIAPVAASHARAVLGFFESIGVECWVVGKIEESVDYDRKIRFG